MYEGKHFTAIVLAAGKGSRMNSDIPKQYMKINGREVLYYSLKVFEDSLVDDIILVVGKEDIDFCRNNIVEKYNINKVVNIVAGGEERYWSVKNGLNTAVGADYVLVHDGARPCIDIGMVHRLMKEVLVSNACTVGVPAKDTIKIVDSNNYGIDTPDRKTLWQVQTPQCFLYDELLAAYDEMEKTNCNNITDDTMIVERFLDRKSKLIMGDYKNIKITTPEDILVADIFLEN